MFQPYPEITEEFLPIPLGKIDEIANSSKTIVYGIVDRFETVLLVLNEMKLGCLAVQGLSEQLAIEKKGFAQLQSQAIVFANKTAAEALEWQTKQEQSVAESMKNYVGAQKTLTTEIQKKRPPLRVIPHTTSSKSCVIWFFGCETKTSTSYTLEPMPTATGYGIIVHSFDFF